MNTISLLSLFQQSETELKAQLKGLVLPKDEDKLNRVLSNLFIEHIHVEKYKEELTNSELSIFQSAIQLVEESLKLQQDMFSFTQNTHASSFTEVIKYKKDNDAAPQWRLNKNQITLLGTTAVGVLAGAATNVGTVLLAIVATAAGLWISKESRDNEFKVQERVVAKDIQVNADAIINAARNICQSIDRLMDMYQTNINNLKSRMETKNQPTLQNMYGYLLDRLANLYRDKTNQAPAEDIEDDISKIFKTLKNYRYKFVNYSEENKHMFDVEEIDGISEPEETEVAILENDICIKEGKYYQPKK